MAGANEPRPCITAVQWTCSINHGGRHIYCNTTQPQARHFVSYMCTAARILTLYMLNLVYVHTMKLTI